MFIACVVCKTTHCLLRFFGMGATSLPGVLALKICPDALRLASKNIGIIAVTGTNGKTTTSRMVERALLNSGKSVCANRAGANLPSGIAAQLIMNRTLLGSAKCQWAVIECDEAACASVIGSIKPRVLIVTNLFRDQLDRYGDTGYPRDCIVQGLRETPDTVAVLNGECPLTVSIAEKTENRALFFASACGRAKPVGSGEDDGCPMCGRKLLYSRISYANLGDFRCACGFRSRKAEFFVSAYTAESEAVLNTPGGSYAFTSALPGLYNACNAAAAACAVWAAGESVDCAVNAAADFERGFGRMEDFAVGKRGARMILIKNAAAADQTLEQVRRYPDKKALVLAINDRTADGTDLSWLDDVDFARLAHAKGLGNVYVCGDRADAAAKRLAAENISCQSCENYDKLIKKLRGEEDFVFILPTYTAMLELRKKLIAALGGKNFWE